MQANFSKVDGDNSRYQGQLFALTMTLSAEEYNRLQTDPSKKISGASTVNLALTLVEPDKHYLNSAGLKMDMRPANMKHDRNQQFTFGKGNWNTVIDSFTKPGMVWDVANKDNLNPPEGTEFYLFPFHGRHNQHFVCKDDRIYSKQSGQVVTYDGGDKPLSMRKTSSSLAARQTFHLILVSDLENNLVSRDTNAALDIVENARIQNPKANLNGSLRFTIQWNDYGSHDNNDLDAHCQLPNGKEIYYSNKVDESSGGSLDTDITKTEEGKPAVENIVWNDKNKMPNGTYRFFVRNYCNRGGKSGFKAQIAFDDKIYEYSYRKPLDDGEDVDVAYVTLNNNKFSIRHCIESHLIN